MIAARRATPTDDLFSVLVHAEVDGDRLDDDEIVFEALLLLIGGDETTRQVTAGGMEQLLAHPDQKREAARRPRRSCRRRVEEMLRWVSPIKNMARTATVATSSSPASALPAGVKVRAALRVGQLRRRATSTSRSASTSTRSPNDHLAFGFGPHFCLGASLARVELQAMFGRLLHRMPDLELGDRRAAPAVDHRHRADAGACSRRRRDGPGIGRDRAMAVTRARE